MNKIKFLFLVLFLNISLFPKADEGMWLPLLLEKLNQSEMQRMGFKLTAADIYSINQSCMKDAVVLFGGGCTAEIISQQGLILTNHHCGYGSIQRHSSIEKDYLTNGFWAQQLKEELPNPGLTATLLIRMEDVTLEVLAGVTDKMTEQERANMIQKNSKEIEKRSVEGTKYTAKIKAFYYGNEFYLFVSQVFKDIRLVGAPPSNIGKFGGDTDNWMWPRHTGDFSLFRIYVNKDNEAAEYSVDNVPYKPKYHFPISLKGVEKGDFTFVFGYPGTTEQYLSSQAVNLTTNIENPIKINLREDRLDIMNKYMENDPKVRIQYSNKYAGIANYWKKMIGETRGVERMNGIEIKKQREIDFFIWTQSTSDLSEKYGKILPAFENIYNSITPVSKAFSYFVEAGLGVEMVRYAYSYNDLLTKSKNPAFTSEEMQKSIQNYKKAAETFFKDYYQPIDKEVFSAILQKFYDELGKEFHPEIFTMVTKKFKGDFKKYADYVFAKSIFVDKAKAMKFLDNYEIGDFKKIQKDPGFELAIGIYNKFITEIRPQFQNSDYKLDSLYRIYVRGLKEMQKDKRFYPDANSTLRITYGKVDGYRPNDGIYYDYYTTLDGIIAKENPKIYDYVVEPKLKELHQTKDYGRYADKDGSLRVAFIATNHTTGGNSGSPVLNDKGQIVGINFDRCWEGTMSDLIYDPSQCRNISVDIRYCLFVIDKIAGASHLIKEMTIEE